MPDTGWVAGDADNGDMTGIEKRLQQRRRIIIIVECRHEKCRARVTPR